MFSQYCQFENYGITCRSSFARLCKLIEMLETNRHVGHLSNSFRSFVNLVLLRRSPRADLRCILLHGLKMTDRSCSASCEMSYEPLHELSCLRSKLSDRALLWIALQCQLHRCLRKATPSRSRRSIARCALFCFCIH